MAEYSSLMCLVVLVLCSVITFTTVHSQDSDATVPKDITSTDWSDAVSNNQKLLVVFYKLKGCPTCQKMVDIITQMSGDPDMDGDVQMAKSSDTTLASQLGVSTYPAVVFLRENAHALYDGKPVVEEFVEWYLVARNKASQHLNDDSFEHLTQASTGATTGDWLVAFYEESCQSIVPLIESVGVRIRQKTNVAVVDSSKSKMLVQRFSIKKCPEIILFKQGKMYRYEVPKVDQASLKSFVESWYRNSKAEDVKPQKSKFDYLTEFIANYIKKQLNGENRMCCLTTLCAAVAVILLIAICCCRSGSSKKQKAE